MKPESTFPQTIREHRKRLDLTQAELAHRVGCASVTIQRIEQGTLRPSRQIAGRLAAIFELTDAEREHFVRLARSGPVPRAEPPAVRAAAPPHAAPDAPPAFPTPLTPLVGRAHEVALVCQMLADETVRWLTLTGPGGIGKTRVAIQAANELAPSFADGVVFVDLAPTANPALVPGAIAAALGLPEPEGAALIVRLQTALQPRRLLLVLDNFEQVVAAAPAVAALLTAAPQLKALVTSRVVAGVSGEHRVDVPPLGFPAPAQQLAWEQCIEYDAVRLFADRVRALEPEIALWESPATVAAICAQLDGIPLAIELAAARATLFSPGALLDQLSRRLPLLTGGARDLPPRQQTLRDTLAWSYGLLDPPVQTLFARLGVFAGSWSLAAAEEVCDEEGTLGVAVVDGLTALVNHSLVRRTLGPEGEPRFTMLATIREYALERLAASGQLDALRWQHARYCLRLAREAEHGLRGAEKARWLRLLDAERDNLSTVLAWPQRGYPREASPGVGAAMVLALAGALWRYWLLRGSTAEWLRWLPAEVEEVLPGAEALAPAIRSRLWARALLGPAALSLYHGDFPATRTLAARCRALFRAAGEPWGEAAALALVGAATALVHPTADGRALLADSVRLARAQGDPWLIAWSLLYAGFELLLGESGPADPEQAHAQLEECLSLARRAGDTWLIAWALNHLGRSALVRQEHGRAAALFEETLAIRRQMRDMVGVAWSLGPLGLVAQEVGDYARALELNEERYAVEQQMGNVLGMSAVRHSQATALATLARYEQAAQAAAESVALARRADDRRRTGWCVLLQGHVARQAADYPQAQVCFEECLAIAEAIGDWKLGAWARHNLAYVASHQGELDRAAGWFRAALAIFRAHDERPGVASSLAGLAATWRAARGPGPALDLLAAADGVLRSGASRLDPADQREYERTLAALRAGLGEAGFAEAWAARRSRCPDEVIAEALR